MAKNSDTETASWVKWILGFVIAGLISVATFAVQASASATDKAQAARIEAVKTAQQYTDQAIHAATIANDMVVKRLDRIEDKLDKVIESKEK